MDEASQSLTGELKEYLSTRGSRIRELGFRDSYAAVLYHDYLIYEEMKNHSAVEKHWFEGDRLNYPGGVFALAKDLNLYSSGRNSGNSAYIRINEKLAWRGLRGLNILVLDDRLQVVSCGKFDTYVTDQAFLRRDGKCMDIE
jgi:hypothetical protein